MEAIDSTRRLKKSDDIVRNPQSCAGPPALSPIQD
jgi:hypothetical protein